MEGILAVDKPQGWTSHDVVDFVRKRFRQKKVGHAGTLDPMATGLLVLLMGGYTKHFADLSGDDKEYLAEIVLGAESDTGDAWGNITPSGISAVTDEAAVRRAFKKFLGRIEQVPPAYSAVKYKGRKLYELARKGISVKVEPRVVFIKELDIIKISLPEVAFRVNCSKGTYIRSLSSDIGSLLGCGAYLSKLRRTRSGKFHVEQAIGIDDLKAIDGDALANRLILS